MHKCLKLIFNKEYGVLKSQNYERISLELLNKHYHITENDFKTKIIVWINLIVKIHLLAI